MKSILQRRLRLGWHWLILAVPFSALVLLAISTGELLVPRRGIGSSRSILQASNPESFALFLGIYFAVAAVGWLFTFYQFRRGSWFNPI
jgi:hypothetical protein